MTVSFTSIFSVVSFELHFRLRRLNAKAFLRSSLRSIHIPSNVEIIGTCFADCNNLSIVPFESNSGRSVLEENVFLGCSALETIWIPSHLQTLVLGHFESSASVDEEAQSSF
jgi:hypothetical protein